MLVLTRRVDEKICIGSDIVITVVAIRGSAVQLGIEAPRNVEVDRLELRQRKQKKDPPDATDAETAPE